MGPSGMPASIHSESYGMRATKCVATEVSACMYRVPCASDEPETEKNRGATGVFVRYQALKPQLTSNPTT